MQPNVRIMLPPVALAGGKVTAQTSAQRLVPSVGLAGRQITMRRCAETSQRITWLTRPYTVGSDRKTKAHVTLTVNDNADVSFHMDTGSSVDILPYDDYVRATDDNQSEKLENTNIRLVMHNKSVVKPMGLAHLQVHRKYAQRQMCVVVARDKVVPLLSLQSCLDLHLVKINDCDAINAVVMQTNEHNPDIGNGSKHTKETTMTQRDNVYACPAKPEMTKPEVTRSKPEVTRPKPEVTSKPKVLQDPVLR